MTMGMKVAAWVSFVMNVVAVVIMVFLLSVIGTLEGKVDRLGDLLPDADAVQASGNKVKDTATAVVRREGCEWNAGYTDEELHAIYARSNLSTNSCMPPKVVDVLNYFGAVAGGDVSPEVLSCIEMRFSEYRKHWDLNRPMYGADAGFGHMQPSATLDWIWKCRGATSPDRTK